MAMLARTDMLDFEKADWDMFAGCETASPLIGYRNDYVIVIDDDTLIRFRARRVEDGLSVPLQIQMLESEMLPYWDNRIAPNGNYVMNRDPRVWFPRGRSLRPR
ncbi:hypothetical protein [Bradyrhizobium sp. USDA 3256]